MKMLEDATAYNFLQEQKIVVVAQFAKYATPENQVISTLSEAKTGETLRALKAINTDNKDRSCCQH
ncbi:MAG TPA: hypothetical protein VN788_08585 [Verrucomicrobiae bacterium]|jgi:hypothetical protein|nr:hypothetical protein [Verrucomicrobiae bacterium]